jgi:hypothetical protein
MIIIAGLFGRLRRMQQQTMNKLPAVTKNVSTLSHSALE